MPAVIPFRVQPRAEYSVLELAAPGRQPVPIGVLLLDPESNEAAFKLLPDRAELLGDEDDGPALVDAEFLEALDLDFTERIKELGGKRFRESLEDSLSHVLRISGSEAVFASNFDRTLQRLYHEHVDTRVRRFATHLPLYSIQAAATKWGEDQEGEISDWVLAPEGMKLNEGMFVARVVGRSMEPLIPDGSFCIFRAPVVGSRNGKRLLIEILGATDHSARYTVKRYTSRKVHSEEGGWEHDEIRLEPLNREFEAFSLAPDQLRVIGEFVQVLEP